MSKFKDITGQRFGRLTVIKRVNNDKHNNARWLCKCDCGNTKKINGSSLRANKILSCGCYHSEMLSKRLFMHGKSNTKLHRV